MERCTRQIQRRDASDEHRTLRQSQIMEELQCCIDEVVARKNRGDDDYEEPRRPPAFAILGPAGVGKECFDTSAGSSHDAHRWTGLYYRTNRNACVGDSRKMFHIHVDTLHAAFFDICLSMTVFSYSANMIMLSSKKWANLHKKFSKGSLLSGMPLTRHQSLSLLATFINFVVCLKTALTPQGLSIALDGIRFKRSI